MAKNRGLIKAGASGSTKDMVTDDRKFEPDKFYELKLNSSLEYPPGSGHWLPPDNYIEMRGDKITDEIKAKIAEAKDALSQDPLFATDDVKPARTNLMGVKSFKR